jgi:hypothetical protein
MCGSTIDESATLDCAMLEVVYAMVFDRRVGKIPDPGSYGIIIYGSRWRQSRTLKHGGTCSMINSACYQSRLGQHSAFLPTFRIAARLMTIL